MGGCCGAMKTGQKSLPDKKKSTDAIQEKPNGKEAAQATVSANDTGKATIDEGQIHTDEKPKDVESHAPEQIAVPVKVSVSHAEQAEDTMEPSVQAAENVMDLETAVAPFESLQQEAQGSITSAEPEVLLPFQIPVQHTFTSTTTTTTTIRHEETLEDFKLRVEEPQLDAAFPGDVQLSITENVQAVPSDEAAVPGENVEILAKSFASAEVESVPEPRSADGFEVNVEEAVARVERAIYEAQLPVEEDLPPPPPLEASQPEELEAGGGRFEVDASLPVPAPLEVPSEPEPRPEPYIAICPPCQPFEPCPPKPERRPEPEIATCPPDPPEPWPEAVIVKCPLERKPEPEWKPRPEGELICPLEPRSGPGYEITRAEPRPEPEIAICPEPELLICPEEQRPEPVIAICEPEPGFVTCPLEEIPPPEPRPEPYIAICEPEPGFVICPLEVIPPPEPRPEPEIAICEPEPGFVTCPLEEIPPPDPRPEPEIVICPLEEIPPPDPRPEPKILICPLEEIPPTDPRPEPKIVICPLEEIPPPDPRPEPEIVICPLEEIPPPDPRPEPEIVICPLEEIPPPEPRPEPEVAVCPPEPRLDLDTQPASEEPTVVHESAHVQEPATAPVPELVSFEESIVTEEAAIPIHEVSSTEEPHFQEKVPVELEFGSKVEEEHHIPAQDDLPPPAVEEPAIRDSLVESYEVLDAPAEHLPQPPVEEEVARAVPIISFTEDKQLGEQLLPNETEQTAVTVKQEQQSEEPAPYQEQQQVEVLEPYHEQQSQEPTPYQERQPEESAEQQPQDPASQIISGTFEETGDAVHVSLQDQEPPRETGEPLPVLEVVAEQVQQNRDAWWNESGKEQSEQQMTTDDIPVLELVSEQTREAHQIWWDQSGSPTEAAQSEETVASLVETAQPPPPEQGSSSEEPWSVLLSETQPAVETAPIQPEETASPVSDGSFPEVVTSEPVSPSSDVVVNQQEAEIILETKALPIVESPLSADGSSTVPTENGELSTQSSDETSVSNLSPESIDAPAAGVAAAATKEQIPTQA